MKILIASHIDPETIEKLDEQHDVVTAFNASNQVLQTLINDRDLLIFRSGVNITAEVMECAPNLKWLIRAGSGIDNLDINYVNQHGLELVRIPGPSAQAVAEMSFAFMLALSRNLLEADRSMRQGRWAKNELEGTILFEKILGIIGVGNTGTRVAEVGVAWGMNVIGYDKDLSPERVSYLRENCIYLTEFEMVISTADYVSIHVPLNNSTRMMIDADVLSMMKPGSFLISLGRGGVVDELALYNALSEGTTLIGAALDVHEQEGEGTISPLVGLSNVILTPHIGASVAGTQREIGHQIQELVDSFMTRVSP